MPYLFPGIETLIADAQADITGSDLPNADGFLPRAILPLMAVIQAGFRARPLRRHRLRDAAGHAVHSHGRVA